jgi:hypothetical protein
MIADSACSYSASLSPGVDRLWPRSQTRDERSGDETIGSLVPALIAALYFLVFGRYALDDNDEGFSLDSRGEFSTGTGSTEILSTSIRPPVIGSASYCAYEAYYQVTIMFCMSAVCSIFW